MKNILIFLLLCSPVISIVAQNSLGNIQPNSNLGLPASYNFQEYVFAEPNDQGNCDGSTNNTAEILDVYMAQTHRQSVSHPMFFNIGSRPALLQVAVVGSGLAPDVSVSGVLNGTFLGELCMSGPEILSNSVDLTSPDFENYFSVTLPKNWMQNGLELMISTGNASRSLSSQELNIGPYVELNLVMVNMDILDFNTEPPIFNQYEDFLQELASAIPASVIRFGIFPEQMTFPEFVVSNNTEQLVRLQNMDDINSSGVPDLGNVNGMANLFLANMQRATGDYLSTIYFGNTLNLTPGGWGGDKSFVGFDYTDIFIHELGHALSLPHWEEVYNLIVESEDDYSYPFGGQTNDGGGRGDSWTFIQDTYEFESPICEDENSDNFSVERSDCMQREFPCLGKRVNDFSPWDGFGYFSSYAMYRYLVGVEVETGQVFDNGQLKNYQLGFQDGFPTLSFQNGQRTYSRDPQQFQGTFPEDSVFLPGEELAEQEVYLVYGSVHPNQNQANIVYEPLKYTGTLPPVIDPTDPLTFSALQNIEPNFEYPLYGSPKDITLKLTYENGDILHALVTQHSFNRNNDSDFGTFRDDVCPFSLVVPGSNPLCKIEVYTRPFIILDEDSQEIGNINDSEQNITAENFMNTAVLKSQYECDTASITEVTEPSLKIYPNPFYKSLSIELTSFENKEIRISDVLGKTVLKRQLTQISSVIDLNSLSSGMYILTLQDNKGVVLQTKKLIKAR